MTIQVGDWVYVADVVHASREVLCPVCFGKQEVTLILGNNDRVVLGCEYCRRGYIAPTGYVKEGYIKEGRVKQVRVSGIDTELTEEGEKVSYRVGSSTAYTKYPSERIFTDETEAQEYADQWAADWQKRLDEEKPKKVKVNKNYTWHAGYHMRKAKECDEEAERHREKAKYFKSKARPREEKDES